MSSLSNQWFELKCDFRDNMNNLCLWIIRHVNRYKDRGLSAKLFDLAEEYNTRPGTFNYPVISFIEFSPDRRKNSPKIKKGKYHGEESKKQNES